MGPSSRGGAKIVVRFTSAANMVHSYNFIHSLMLKRCLMLLMIPSKLCNLVVFIFVIRVSDGYRHYMRKILTLEMVNFLPSTYVERS